MENLVLLMYGDSIPPQKHIHKIIDKYSKYFLNDWEKEDFPEEEYVEITIEERYLGLQTRKSEILPTVPIKYEYLSKFINIFKSFNCDICLCMDNHEHPIASIDDIEYEGYCYYLKDENKKILFLDEYSIENLEMNSSDYYEELIKESKFNLDFLIRENMIERRERHVIDDLEWYRNVPVAKRFKIVEANTDTEIAFEQWLKEMIQLG